MAKEHEQRDANELLKDDIQTYCDNNLYIGFKEPFLVDRLGEDFQSSRVRAFNPGMRDIVVYMANVEEEAIGEKDYPWEEGLNEQVGRPWETRLRLPYWYYER